MQNSENKINKIKIIQIIKLMPIWKMDKMKKDEDEIKNFEIIININNPDSDEESKNQGEN